MSRYRFHTVCPVCLENEKFYWVHSEDNGADYIWDNCDLECDKCKNRSFILEHQFNCGRKNHNTYESIDLYDLISVISEVSNIEGLNGPARKNMLNILKTHAQSKA